MKHLCAYVALITLCTSFSPAPAQIRTGATGDYNGFGVGPPLSGDIANSGDLMVTNDIEVGGELYLDRTLFMDRQQAGGLDGDQIIAFYDNNALGGASLLWDDSEDRFVLSDDLQLSTESPRLVGTGDLHMEGTGFFQTYTAFDTGAGGPFYNWIGKTSGGSTTTLMNLVGPNGNLRLRGVLMEMDLSLAENFWTNEPLQPGELAVLEPGSPHSVRRSSEAYQQTLIGVVTDRPGVALGAAPLESSALRRVWGPTVEQEYLRQADDLRTRVLEQILEQRLILETQVPSASEDKWADDPATQERLFEEVEQHALALFFEESFASVALAGRVPVRVDASYGPINPGDPLTASPTPGRAMGAIDAGPVIGKALEGLDSGEGEVVMLVQSGWYAGDAVVQRSLASRAAGGNGPPPTAAVTEGGTTEIEELVARLAALEERLQRLTAPDSALLESVPAGSL